MSKSETSSRKRVFMVLTCVTMAFLLLAGRLFYLQVVVAASYSKMSSDQRERGLPIAAKRGTIYDRNMNILAMSASAKTVAVRPGVIATEKNEKQVVDLLSSVLNMDRATIEKKVTQNADEVWVKRQISDQETSAILDANLKGIALVEDTKRSYPMNNMMAQVIGYTTVDGVGQEGLEAKYDKYLAGYPGMEIAERDQKGNELPYSEAYRIPPVDGFNLVTTLDLQIQSFVENAMDNCIAATKPKGVYCIAMDPNTGEILAMANKPDYDLNNPPRQDVSQLMALSRNSCVLDVYEPGSTFKVITTAAALEEKAVTVDSTFFCSGSVKVDGQTINCWRTGRPHGSQNLIEGVCNSCNPVFVDLALKLGKDKFYDYLDAFGFGQYTNIDFSSDEKGLVMQNKYVKSVDLARMSFGQAIAVTPLQLIQSFSAVINGGKLLEPHLVKQMTNDDGETVKDVPVTDVRQVISKQTSDTMRSILEEVVTSGGGKNAYIPGYRVGGKTGTAQKYENGVIVPNKNVSSFIGFAPANDPKIAVLMVVDEPSCPVHFGSVVAAPYVKDIIGSSLKYMNVPTQNLEQDLKNDQATITMPNVVGQDAETAEQNLLDLGLNVDVDGTGQVTDQYPAAGEKLVKDAAVGLVGKDPPAQDVLSSLD